MLLSWLVFGVLVLAMKCGGLRCCRRVFWFCVYFLFVWLPLLCGFGGQCCGFALASRHIRPRSVSRYSLLSEEGVEVEARAGAGHVKVGASDIVNVSREEMTR